MHTVRTSRNKFETRFARKLYRFQILKWKVKQQDFTEAKKTNQDQNDVLEVPKVLM